MTKNMKWLVILLVISLSVNIFIAGVWIGNGFSVKSVKRMVRPPSPEFNIRGVARHLEAEDRDALRAIMRAERDAMRGRFEARREIEDEIRKLLTAPEVDQDALTQALDEYAVATRALFAPARKVLLEFVPSLSQETREKIAENLFKGPERRPPNERRHRRPPPPRH